MAGIGHFATTTPDAAAIVTVKGALTFAELDDRQRRLAGSLRKAKIRERDRVAVLSTNRPESLEVTIGCLRAGIVPVPINPLLTDPEIAYVVEDCGARWLFADRTFEHPSLDQVVTFGDAYERSIAEAKPVDLCDFVRGRPMHYTSGTTGVTKGVWVTPEDEATSARRSHSFRALWALEPSDIHLVVSPLAHSAPHRFSTRTLEAGGTIVLQAKFDPMETLVAIELFGITSTFMVPTHLERLLGLGHALKTHDLSSVRLLAHAGAPIREETKRTAIEVFPTGSVWEFYGSTEGQATRISTEEWLRKPGSVGAPLPGVRVLILDEAGNELPPGGSGEVWVEDPEMERFAYWGDKAKTRLAWQHGAFTAGDLGSLDNDGYLYLTGRKHDTIITGGVNVYPQEVERVLAGHPAVAEVVVFGVPHEEWGQEVHAWVVPGANMPLDGDRLRAWARERLAGYKCPRKIDIVDDLPRTPTGKIKRPTSDHDAIG
jgi:long-chain acyl-CoA synthetase